ncbi:hypothetical protein EBL87_20890 [Cereibacter sphaeroides]|uniref:transposase n=1 Tax=Cereibacter sphaeroides TaxID=1063 RepID=UPI000F51E591|nr:transposase [Cereibacter sphaeroides]AZB66162.1 hypothetical protein EBL87_20890 [Cereibacter sphaeroides]AZB70982.1 hypothetical protein EBL86_21855 [Cereibacter sphaeroides]
MSRPIPPTYKTRNWSAYNEALKRRGSLTIWFDPEMSWDAVPTGRRGRQQTYSDTAIQTCLTMKVLRAAKYLGLALWRRWSGYHRRSRVETKMHCMKLLGQRLMARDFDRQVAELQVRIAVLNGYTALGIPVTEAVG